MTSFQTDMNTIRPATNSLFSFVSSVFYFPNRISRFVSTSVGRVSMFASLARRRAFSSGLSHAKCPKPGFRSNVFG